MPSAAYEPDRGYAWVVVAACFVLSFLMPGLSMTSGQLYVALTDEYGVAKELASLPFTMRFCVRCMLGPIIGALGQRFGVRPIVLIGGIVSFIGGIVSSLAPNVTWITVGWGGLQGLGYALSHVIHFLMILRYFDKYKAIATGMALSGDIAAAFIFPPLIEHLLFAYNIHGTFLILAALSLHAVPAAMLLVPPAWEKPSGKKATKPEKSERVFPDGGFCNDGFDADTVKTKNYLNSLKVEVSASNQLKITAQIIDECFVSQNGNRVHVVCANDAGGNFKSLACQQDTLHLQATGAPVHCADQPQVGSLFQEGWRTRTSSFGMNAKNTQASPIFTTSASCEPNTKAINEYKPFDFEHYTTMDLSKPDNDLKKQNKDNILIDDKKSQGQVKESSGHACNPKKENTKDQISPQRKEPNVFSQFLGINRKPMFLLIGVSMGVWYVFFIAVFTILIDYAIECDMSVENGNYLIVAYAVADGAGRLLLGVVLDRRWLSVPQFAGLTTGLMGAFAFVMPFWPDFAFWMVSFSVSGFIQGGCCVMYPILVEQYMEKGEVSMALGSLNLYGGLMMLPVPKMIGLFKDNMGTYDGVFWTTGALNMFAGCLWLLEPFLLKLTSKSSIPESEGQDLPKNKI